jgi:hypothetical protein
MQWTKVRKLVHDSFADAVRDRVQVNVTNAHPRRKMAFCADNCTHGSISVDGRVIAQTDPTPLKRMTLSLPWTSEGEVESKTQVIVEPFSGQKVPAGARTGTFMELTEACWQYLHSSIADSLASPDPFVSSLAMLNAKVGRTRLRRALDWDLHPLTRAMLEFRLKAELDARSTAAA